MFSTQVINPCIPGAKSYIAPAKEKVIIPHINEVSIIVLNDNLHDEN